MAWLLLLCFFSVSPQWQRYLQHGRSLPVVCPDLSVRLRLPRTAPQLRPRASQTALTAAASRKRQPDPENQPLFLLPLCFDVKKCASGGRHLKLLCYTGSFNMKYWSEPDTTRFQTELYCFLCSYDGPASPLHSIDILLMNHRKLYLCK